MASPISSWFLRNRDPSGIEVGIDLERLTGSRRLRRDPAAVAPKASAARGVAVGQQVLPWGGVLEVPLSLQWQQLAERCRRVNEARASAWETRLLF